MRFGEHCRDGQLPEFFHDESLCNWTLRVGNALGRLSLDPNSGTIYVCDSHRPGVYEVAPVTGHKVRLTGFNDGGDLTVVNPSGIIHDPVTDTIFLSSNADNLIFQMDKTTGSRMILSK